MVLEKKTLPAILKNDYNSRMDGGLVHRGERDIHGGCKNDYVSKDDGDGKAQHITQKYDATKSNSIGIVAEKYTTGFC